MTPVAKWGPGNSAGAALLYPVPLQFLEQQRLLQQDNGSTVPVCATLGLGPYETFPGQMVPLWMQHASLDFGQLFFPYFDSMG